MLAAVLREIRFAPRLLHEAAYGGGVVSCAEVVGAKQMHKGKC